MLPIESSNLDSEVLFTVTQKNAAQVSRNSKAANSNQQNEDSNDAENTEQSNSILCTLWKNGKMGAAYFLVSDQQLYVLQEMIDLQPEFGVTRSLFREVNPTYIMAIGTRHDPYVKCLISLLLDEDDDSGSTSVQTTSVPSNMSLLYFKEYTFEECEMKVHNLSLPSEPENATDAQKAVFLHSLIDFDCKMSVHALGALIKFTEKNWAHLNEARNDELRFLHVNQISLADNVLIDRNTFNGLQIFQTRSHDARFKHGRESSNREGLSVFKHLAQFCKSKLGFTCLRNILMSPTKDIHELNKRLDFVQFALIPANQGFIESLQDNLKRISDINMVLRKIQYSRATGRDWETLYSAIYHTLFMHELCGPYRASSSLLRCLAATISTKLYDLQCSINSALDFSHTNVRNRPVIKFGLDEELDAKELRKQDIAKNVTAAAKFALNQLPDFLNECSVVHIPQMGHMVVIKEWEPSCNPHRLQDYGFRFVFRVNELIHYTNAMCAELDKQLGNIHQDIAAHENRIIQRLAEFVLRYNKEIREPLKIVALIDCLISVSRVAKNHGYIRPHLNQDSVQEIKNGRHPLLELLCSDFVPNDYYSGKNYSHIKILTGPNDSGKSVYLKQTALIIFLAHVGSYVPATNANIGMVHSIHCRIHATESAGVSLSAFMLDLSQMSQALHNAKSTSLILLDEFGRGTTGNDGIALLVGALMNFYNQKELCPHVLVSTHLQQMCGHLPKSELITYIKMDHARQDPEGLIFLYKVVAGISNSFAFDVAASAGLDNDVIMRARQIYTELFNSSNIGSAQSASSIDSRSLNLSDIAVPEPDD